MNRFEHLDRARQFLITPDQVSREQLQEAARLWWAAMLDYETWPDEVRHLADATQSLLFRRGVIRESIKAMNDAELLEASDSLRRLCEGAEHAAEQVSEWRPGM